MADHVCPFWVGYILANPLRKLLQNPRKILRQHVREGMTVVDIGCAMGFFTLALPKLVGPQGRVIAVDVQPRMIETLRRRVAKAGLADRIETRVCGSDTLGMEDLAGLVDLVIAPYVVHEVPEVPSFMMQVYAMLRSGGRFLFIEPRGHITAEGFKQEETAAQEAGFEIIDHPRIRRSRAALAEKR
ncbi:MAG: class I SAM-dependent methyltransferase [Phycisphaerae bacterium]|nr:class I SAM-dependent methyltransferase [Phycisphaerae bacterium]